MIRKAAQMESEVRTALRGGPGAVTVQHLFKSNEIPARTRLGARRHRVDGDPRPR